MNTLELNGLHLAYNCPAWCQSDHSVEVPADDQAHEGKLTEVRMPDGSLVLDVQMVRESDALRPQLVVTGPFQGIGLDVACLDAEQAENLHMQLMRLAEAVRQTLRPLAGKRPRSGAQRSRENKGQDKRSGWRETRYYLAERDGRRCFYCRTKFDGMTGATTDHYVPYSLWACNLPANLVLACEPCNQAKADRLTWSMAAVLLSWATREGGTAGDGNGDSGDVQAAPARASLASLAG
ncbi:HNH endonuclease [Streptomyces anthocyanicus]|uniref:HNH endonuclease n=1 Tax=Streptomyces anthocyanicus TaxID=68174 RepID=UPI00362D0A7B